MAGRTDPEGFIREFGEPYRRLITSSLAWLDEHEPHWGLNEPMDRHEFVKGLVSKAILREGGDGR